jgi:hypothetical protein
MTGYRMTDPFGQVRSRVCQLAVMVSVTVIGYMTGSSGHGHASAALNRPPSVMRVNRCAWHFGRPQNPRRLTLRLTRAG